MKQFGNVITGGSYFDTVLQEYYAGKWFIVTGASSGIGYLITKGLLALNANVIAVARWQKKNEREEIVSTQDDWWAKLQKDLGRNTPFDPSRLLVIVKDLSQVAACKSLASAVHQNLGKDIPIHGIFNAAGMLDLRSVFEISSSTADKMMRLNGLVPQDMCRAFLPNLVAAESSSSEMYSFSLQFCPSLERVNKLGSDAYQNPREPEKDIFPYAESKFAASRFTEGIHRTMWPEGLHFVSFWPERAVDTPALAGGNKTVGKIHQHVLRRPDASALACLLIGANAMRGAAWAGNYDEYIVIDPESNLGAGNLGADFMDRYSYQIPGKNRIATEDELLYDFFYRELIRQLKMLEKMYAALKSEEGKGN